MEPLQVLCEVAHDGPPGLLVAGAQPRLDDLLARAEAQSQSATLGGATAVVRRPGRDPAYTDGVRVGCLRIDCRRCRWARATGGCCPQLLFGFRRARSQKACRSFRGAVLGGAVSRCACRSATARARRPRAPLRPGALELLVWAPATRSLRHPYTACSALCLFRFSCCRARAGSRARRHAATPGPAPPRGVHLRDTPEAVI